jgi:hypothetical protein
MNLDTWWVTRRDILLALEANKGENHWVLRRIHQLLPTVEDFQKA